METNILDEKVIFDDDGKAVSDDQLVKVNGNHEGRVHINDDGSFTVEGWPDGVPFDSLVLV